MIIRCYRGVAEDHIYYQEALRGIARPRGGTATVAEHNGGNTKSEFTSWTTSYQIAMNKALESDLGGHGVVLRRDFDRAELILSPDTYDESEWFVFGIVGGASVKEVPE